MTVVSPFAVANDLLTVSDEVICSDYSQDFKNVLQMETAKLSSTIRNLEKENVSLIKEKENMKHTYKELQHNIIDCNHTIVHLCKSLSIILDNLQEEISERNFVDQDIASLCTSFTYANQKLMKAVSERDAFEWCATHYKREHNDNDQYIKKLERKLDDRESEIEDLCSRICTYQEWINFLEPWNVWLRMECTIM